MMTCLNHSQYLYTDLELGFFHKRFIKRPHKQLKKLNFCGSINPTYMLWELVFSIGPSISISIKPKMSQYITSAHY